MEQPRHAGSRSRRRRRPRRRGGWRVPWRLVAQRIEARSLYWRGWSLAQIAEELALPVSTLSSWKQRQRWDTASPRARAEECLWVRYQTLLAKEQKTGSDFKEIDLLGRQFVTFARIGKFSGEEGNEADLNPARSKGAHHQCEEGAGQEPDHPRHGRRPARRHAGGPVRPSGDLALDHASAHADDRQVAPDRGDVVFCARAAARRARNRQEPDLPLGLARAGQHLPRLYRPVGAEGVRGELKGDPIAIQRGEGEDGAPLDPVELYFLGTNYRTAQGYHGDVVIDECFWIYGFEELFKVAAAMATHKIYTRTLFSTPARSRTRPIRCGAATASTAARADKVRIDIDHDALREWRARADGIWRQIVTVFDAIAKGFDLVDLEELQRENALDEFDNLFRCLFLDDSQSMFPFEIMRRCMVDSWDVWRDVQPYAAQPYAGEVWLGYDPNASEAARATMPRWWRSPRPRGRALPRARKEAPQGPPVRPAGRRDPRDGRALSVTRIAIDVTGAGKAVEQIVRKWFPLVTAITYSPLSKSQMVLKAKNVITPGVWSSTRAGWT
jgi:hypothetical protein